jgi:cell division protein ZapE
VLRRLHPIRYRALLTEIETLFVANVHTIAGQNDALRFVHFIDQLYDQQTGLRASGEIPLHELFDQTYRHSAYQRKHERSISRLGELLEEPLETEEEHDGPGEQDELDRAHGFD